MILVDRIDRLSETLNRRLLAGRLLLQGRQHLGILLKDLKKWVVGEAGFSSFDRDCSRRLILGLIRHA